MKRFSKNPILKPIPENYWETRLVFNAAAIQTGSKIYLLYRAIGNDMISRIGLATTSDGYTIEERCPQPIFSPEGLYDNLGCEDPRITQIGQDCIMTYTAFRAYPRPMYQIALTKISIEDVISWNWAWKERRLPFDGILNKNAVISPRKKDGLYVMFNRIEPDLCIAYSSDLKHWCGLKSIVQVRPNSWDSLKIGAAGPPIELNEGLLLIYHGVNFDKVYRLGVLLLDKDDPETILYRSEDPILEPKKDYELFGHVPNVVFSCGNILLDDKLIIYYGGADTVVCGVEYDLGEILP